MKGKGALLVGLALQALSIYLYFLYQSLEYFPVGLSSVFAFAAGSYLTLGGIRLFEPFRKMLPFLVIGAAASLVVLTFDKGAYVANSLYGTALAFASSRLTAFLLTLAGINTQVSGYVLLFPNGRALSVGPLCNGAYTTVLFLLLSFLMVADIGRRAPRRRLFVALGIGILGANLANVLRITLLASIMYLFSESTMGIIHQFAGYVIFLAFMSVFWLLSLRWLIPRSNAALS